MKRILCCFHMLEDPELISEEEWTEGLREGHVDTSYIKKTLNTYDEGALELALRFRDLSEEPCELTALTVGGRVNDSILGTLAALGFERTVRIDMSTDEENLSSDYIAGLLLAFIRRQEPYDVIMTGLKSGDGNQGKIPVILAEELAFKCITSVLEALPYKFSAEESGETGCAAEVSWETDEAVCTARIPYPMLLAVGTVPSAYLRVPTLKQRMGTKNHKTEIETVDELIREEEAAYTTDKYHHIRLLGIEAVHDSRETILVKGLSPEDAADRVMEYYERWSLEQGSELNE